MVRLKDNSSNVIFSFVYISIPYGAIKSMVLAFKDGRQNYISIPYGAIKRLILIKN